MAEHAPSSDGHGDRRRLNPAALPITFAAQVLSRASGQQIAEEMLRADIDDGAPTNADGTINLVQYAAWLVQQMSAPGGRRGD